jgi:hypothetical protein
MREARRAGKYDAASEMAVTAANTAAYVRMSRGETPNRAPRRAVAVATLSANPRFLGLVEAGDDLHHVHRAAADAHLHPRFKFNRSITSVSANSTRCCTAIEISIRSKDFLSSRLSTPESVATAALASLSHRVVGSVLSDDERRRISSSSRFDGVTAAENLGFHFSRSGLPIVNHFNLNTMVRSWLSGRGVRAVVVAMTGSSRNRGRTQCGPEMSVFAQ